VQCLAREIFVSLTRGGAGCRDLHVNTVEALLNVKCEGLRSLAPLLPVKLAAAVVLAYSRCGLVADQAAGGGGGAQC
jgi:hypothetical protein